LTKPFASFSINLSIKFLQNINITINFNYFINYFILNIII